MTGVLAPSREEASGHKIKLSVRTEVARTEGRPSQPNLDSSVLQFSRRSYVRLHNLSDHGLLDLRVCARTTATYGRIIDS